MDHTKPKIAHNKGYLLFIGLAILAGLISYSLARSNSSPIQNKTASSAENSIIQVSLFSDHADPDTLSVKEGRTIQFNNKDGKKHFLTSGEGGKDHQHVEGGFESGEFGTNEAWKATFHKKGTYTFHDHNHPLINILIVVY